MTLRRYEVITGTCLVLAFAGAWGHDKFTGVLQILCDLGALLAASVSVITYFRQHIQDNKDEQIFGKSGS